MPRLAASDVPHTSQTDHRILRKPRGGQAKIGTTGPAVIFDRADEKLSRIETNRARGLFLAMNAEDSKNSAYAAQALKLLRPVLAAAPDDLPTLEAIGSSFLVSGENKLAREYWEKALRLSPRHERILTRLAKLCHDTGDSRAGLAYLDRLLKINRWNSELYGRHAHMLGQLGEFDRGIVSAERGLKLNPSNRQLREWLVNAYKKALGDQDSAKRHQGILDRLRPAKQ